MDVERTSDEFSLREFRGDSNDAGAASALLRSAPESAAWSAQSLMDSLSDPGVCAYLTERTSITTGFIIARRLQDEAEILNLVVHASHRRQREGRALLQKVLNQFESRGVTRVFLEVRETNTVAIAFYKTFGFLPISTRKNYYNNPPEGAVVMERIVQKISTD
jgi:[ribosomal protein S18]-alanine N-acetyltransferase